MFFKFGIFWAMSSVFFFQIKEFYSLYWFILGQNALRLTFFLFSFLFLKYKNSCSSDSWLKIITVKTQKYMLCLSRIHFSIFTYQYNVDLCLPVYDMHCLQHDRTVCVWSRRITAASTQVTCLLESLMLSLHDLFHPNLRLRFI